MAEEYKYDSPLAKYALHATAGADAMGVLDTLGHGTVATVVDAGTTLWNSLTPQRLEASTEDLLSRIDSNALQVYNEHPDAVRLASFVAGSVGPVGLALKGMNVLRAGSKTVSWFSKAGTESRLAEVKAAFAGGVGNTERVAAAQRMVYQAKGLNVLADNVAAEAAIMGAMSSHPYMEDYYKDLGTNFAINMAIGSIVGGIGGIAIARSEITGVKKEIEQEFTSTANALAKAADPSTHVGVQLQQHMQNVSQIEGALSAAESADSKFVLTQFTKDHLANLKIVEEANAVRVLEEVASEDLLALDAATQGSIRKLLSDPKFSGFDKLSFLPIKDTANTFVKEPGTIQKLFDFTKKVVSKKGVERTVANDGVYSPVWNGFIGKEEAYKYSTLADLGTSVESLATSVDKRVGFLARVDAGMEHSVGHTAVVEKDFAQAYLRMSQLDIQDVVGKILAASPDDLASMKAMYLRVSEFAREGNSIDAVKTVLTKETPSYEAIQRTIAQRAGFPRTYLDDIAKINETRLQYQVYDGHQGGKVLAEGLSKNAQSHIVRWISGDTAALRKAGIQLANPSVKVGAKIEAVEALREFQHHPRSRALRKTLSGIADSDGFVLMYRGLGNAPKGHFGMESYTLDPGKAGAFSRGNLTGLRMYKVHVDEVIGMVEDIGPKTMSNMEILVMRSATRENAVIPTHDLSHAPSKFFSDVGELIDTVTHSAPSTRTVSLSELADAISETTLAKVKEYQLLGMGVEEISLRTGTPVDTIMDIITSGKTHVDVSELIKFGSQQSIIDAAAVTNRALLVGTNMNKVPTAELQAALNASSFKNLGQQMVEHDILTSSSEFVRGIGEQLLNTEAKTQLTWIEKGVDDLLGTAVGSTLFRSANSALEKLGPVGELITGVGKRLVTIKNLAKERLTTPLSQAMSTLTKNDAYIIEFNNAINIQAKVVGAKIYKAGQFWEFNAGKASIDSLVRATDKEFLAYAHSVDKSGTEMLRVLTGAGGSEFKVVVPEVDAALRQVQSAGRELYAMKNVSHKALGKGNLSDIGFWVPANNPRGKQIAYAFNRRTGETTMLMARTPTELNSFIERFKGSLGEEGKHTDIVTKAQQADFNKIAGRHDPMYMAVADAGKQHGGSSALAEISTTADSLADIIQGYDHYINRGIDDIARIQLNPIMSKLDNMSLVANVGYSKAALGAVEKGATRKQDPGNVIKNILMGRSNLEEHEGWSAIQSGVQMIMDRSLKAVAEVMAPVIGKGARTEADWLKVQAELEARGIVHPFQVFLKGEEQAVPDVARLKQAYLAQSPQTKTSLSPRAVALSNSLAATVVLRFGELAQPLVNMLSLPILTSGAINKKLAASYAGATLDSSAKFSTAEAMMDGVALMHSQHGKKWAALAEKAALFKDDWRTVNGIFKDIRNLEPGMMSKVEDALDSKLVNMMSKPADWSEQVVRRTAFFTAVGIAKKAYPTLGEGGVMTFARNFMDEAIGNYAAAQRPAMFQGTVGMAMGLFQTYMLTMAQQIYRQVETRNWQALAKMMLTQQTIFGTASLPGFHPISELIGSHYSDDNYDITSSTFRAFDDKTSEMILYGLPSQLVGITTRGDIQPRVPLAEGVSSLLPSINILTQSFAAMDRVASAAFTVNENAGVAMLEALSLQSISRPIARLSELGSGHAITSTGKLISTAEDIYTPAGVISRVFAARPIEEIKNREALHLDSLYGSIDKKKRSKITARLKSHLANGTLDQEVIENLAYEYMRTGSPTGWRSAVNEAIGQTSRTGSANVREHLSKNSALMSMMDDLD